MKINDLKNIISIKEFIHNNTRPGVDKEEANHRRHILRRG